jgi:hypothetical protein
MIEVVHEIIALKLYSNPHKPGKPRAPPLLALIQFESWLDCLTRSPNRNLRLPNDFSFKLKIRRLVIQHLETSAGNLHGIFPEEVLVPSGKN